MSDRRDSYGDPIAALATPAGRSALGIVRMSGERVWEIAARATGLGDSFHNLAPRRAELVTILGERGDPIDEGVILPWRGPRSSTGEDMVEYIGHGSPEGLRLVLERFLALGARPAEPGEFTRRGFINGKLTLDQAESVASYIDAKTSAAARAAVRVLLGGLKARVHALQNRLEDDLGLVELELDFSEEELRVFDRGRFLADVRWMRSEIAGLLQQARASRYLREGVHVVIAGETNAGKSTLFNRWAGHERAIVSATPGTTRDYIDAAVDWRGLPVHLYDTAGLRASPEEIEAEGMRRTRGLVDQADVLLWLVAPPEFALPDPGWREDDRLLLVRNKNDLPGEPGAVAFTAEISATTGEGVQALQRLIAGRILQGATIDDSLALEQRHVHRFRETDEALARAGELAQSGESEELIAAELRLADDALGEITGRAGGSEQLLDRIFSRFCIGK